MDFHPGDGYHDSLSTLCFRSTDQKEIGESGDNENEEEHPGSSKKRKLDFITSVGNSSYNDDIECATGTDVDADDAAIDEANNEPQTVEEVDIEEQQVLLSSFSEKMKQWADDEDDASDFQKLLLKQAGALRKQQEIPVERTAFATGKVLEDSRGQL